MGGPQTFTSNPTATNAYRESYVMGELGATSPGQEQRHFEPQLGPPPVAELVIHPIREEPSSHTATHTEVLLRKDAKLVEHSFPYGGGEESALETSNTRKLNTERSYSNISNLHSQ